MKLSRRLSQLCLHAGANDYGGTLMEENISREAGATAGQYTSPEDFQSLILEAGRIPAERNTTYTRIKHQAAPRRAHRRRNAGAGICLIPRPIAILGGTGPAGMGLALRWTRAGETIIIGSRGTRNARKRQPPTSKENPETTLASPAWKIARHVPLRAFWCLPFPSKDRLRCSSN